MPSNHERELDRVSAETAKRTAASHASCLESAVHVRSSRSAIERSFELLARSFTKA